MEKNNYICPRCGAEMFGTYEKPALNLTCPKCGCKIATTKWDDIDLDNTVYIVSIVKCDNPNIEQIKLVSKITGQNFFKSKEIIINGEEIFRGKALDIIDFKKQLNINCLEIKIVPQFNY